MNILLVTDRMGIGGAETHVLELATALQRMGHSVLVASCGGEGEKRLIRRDIPHLRLPLHRKDPFSLWHSYRALRRCVQRQKIDVLHAHARVPAWICHHLALALPICFVTTVHARFRADGMRRRLSHWGYAAVAVSHDLRDALLSTYPVFSPQVEVIPNGIDTRRFSPSPFPASPSPPHLLYLSRLDRDCCRTATLLCEIAPELVRRHGRIRITLGGGGTASAAIEEMARQVNDRLGFCCIVTTGTLQDPAPLLRACDLFIGVSRCALEAMACETPVLLSGDEGFFGLLTADKLAVAAQSNFCARSCPLPSADLLLNAVSAFFAMSAEQKSRLGKQLRQYVLRCHDSEKIALRTLRFYQNAQRMRPTVGADVLLCGYYGYGNCGDDALLRAAIQRAHREYPTDGICAMTRRPRADRFTFGVHTVSRKNPFAVLRAMRHAHTLIYGGGTLFQDRSSRRSLLYYRALLGLALRRGCRVVLWSNGLEDFRSPLAKRATLRLLCRCQSIGLRDAASMRRAESWHLPPSLCRRESDLALASPSFSSAAPHDRLLRLYAPPASLPFAILSLHGNASREELECACGYIRLLRENGLRILIAILHHREDRATSLAVAHNMGCVCIEHFSAEELTVLLSRASLALGMRLHLLLLARRAGIPHLPIGKIDKLYAEYYEE